MHEDELQRWSTLDPRSQRGNPSQIRMGEEEEEEEEEERESDDKDDKKEPKDSPIALDLLRKERTIFISEDVSPKLTQRLSGSLLWLDSLSEDPIKLYINTPGGSADDGFAIHDMIRFIKAPVYCISLGLNASAGTLILLGAPKERRLALPNARIMIHQPSGGGQGRTSDLEITAKEIVKLRHRANQLIADECGRAVEQVEADTDRDCWMSAEEAVDYGLVSRVVPTLRDIF
jgi:ATP-dependent Clp protease protease subunit